MKILLDIVNRIMFGWSAKSGCSHVKKLYKYLSSYEDHIRLFESRNIDETCYDFEKYLLIIIIRNPFERLVSGFLDKYKPTGHCYHLWNNNMPLTFKNFVDELIKGDFKMIEEHHFTPQLSEEWSDSMRNQKKCIIYEINNIDYNTLESIYNKEIPIEIKCNKDNENKNTEIIDYPIYDIPLSEYYNKKPLLKCFYDEDIRKKVEHFYKCDFDFFKEKGFDYTLDYLC